MPPTTIHSAPALDSFTPLADHQSQTPEVFYGAKPVLHYHAVGARALASRDQLSKLPIFSQTQAASDAAEGEQPEGSALVAEIIDAYISSESVAFDFLCPHFHIFVRTVLLHITHS